jgi:hypothetical protein
MYPQVRGSQGEHTQVKDGLLDLSNKKRLGITEFHLVRQQGKSLTALIFLYIFKIRLIPISRPSVKAVSSTFSAIVTILGSGVYRYAFPKMCAVCGLLLNGTIVGFCRAFRPCAARSCLFRLVNSQNGTLRALFPAYYSFAASLLMIHRKIRKKSQF